MKKLLIILFLLSSSPVFAATYYVRTDGGTCGAGYQCSGTTDAAYPGTGINQACACNHPNWVIGHTAGNAGLMVGGDTLIIKNGSYQLGCLLGQSDCVDSQWDAATTVYNMYKRTSCYSGDSGGCILNSIPSGTAEAHTKILGENWNSGCSSKPELWGRKNTWKLLHMTGTSGTHSQYIDIECLDITDHENCQAGGANPPTPCTSESSPIGIYASYADNIYLKNLNIHGLSIYGIVGNKVSNWTVEDSNIRANGYGGWQGDTVYSGPTGDSGTITFNRTAIEYNGCGETYPGLSVIDCWGQSGGRAGYGDGFGFGDASMANWEFNNSVISHNTQDGFDGLHGDGTGTLKVLNSKFEGNAGQDIKSINPLSLENSIIIGNCGYFSGKSFTSTVPPCRANATIALKNVPDVVHSINNSTILSNADLIFYLFGGSCNSSSKFKIRNSIVYGGKQWTDDTSNPYAEAPAENQDASIYYNDGTGCDSSNFDENYNICYGLKEGSSSCNGLKSSDTVIPNLVGPILLGPYSTTGYFSGDNNTSKVYLASNSNAIDLADETITCVGDCSIDYNYFSRGSSWDIGALEYGSTTGGDTPECGNNLQETGETCDGTDLNSETCVTQGFDSGTLTCAANCGSFITSECASAVCGDGTLDTGEECDDNNNTNGDGCSSICTTEVAQVENLLDCTETDPTNVLGVTESKVDIVGITHTTDTNVQCDYGASYFGDFAHRFKVTITACNDDGGGEDGGAGIWALTSSPRASLYALETANDGVVVSLGCASSFARHTWKLYSANNQEIDSYEDSAPTLVRYFEVQRAGTTLTAKIYSDSAYTTLLDTLSVTSLTTAYRYLYAGTAYNDGVPGTSFTGTVEDLDLDLTDNNPEPPSTSTISGCGMNVGSLR